MQRLQELQILPPLREGGWEVWGMQMRVRMVTTALALLALPIGLRADCAHLLGQLKGWTVVGVTAINGEFEGCDFGRKIKLDDGSVLTCAGYSYMYAYHPDAIIFGKRSSFNGHTFISLRLVVEDEVFEMEPEITKD
jgi:hypothetical protein